LVDEPAARALLAPHGLLELLEREAGGAQQDLAQAEVLELRRCGAHGAGSST
jgi:hypothetical protein